MSKENTKSAIVTLGTLSPLPTATIGWTVSISDKAKLKLPHIRRKLEWKYLTPSQQYRFLANDYLNKVVRPHTESFEARFELNKSGNVHMHILAEITALPNQHEYEIWALRKAVTQIPLVWSLTTHKAALSRMNYIHPLKDIPDWQKYIRKDELRNPLPPIIKARSA